MEKIVPFLWFNDKAEEAARFYVSIFRNSRLVSAQPTIFEIEGRQFYAFNGGPHFSFTPAISLFVSCETQAEVDELWEKLLSGSGKESRCGWLTDRYGLSWQIIPTTLGRLMQDPDPKRAARVREAMLKMIKLDIAKLQAAYDGDED